MTLKIAAAAAAFLALSAGAVLAAEAPNPKTDALAAKGPAAIAEALEAELAKAEKVLERQLLEFEGSIAKEIGKDLIAVEKEIEKDVINLEKEIEKDVIEEERAIERAFRGLFGQRQ